MEERRLQFEEDVETARAELEDRQNEVAHQMDECMEKMEDVQEFLYDVDGLPLSDAIAEGVRRIKYDSREIYVWDINTEEPIVGANVTVWTEDSQVYTTDIDGSTGVIDFLRDSSAYIDISADGYYTHSTSNIEDDYYLFSQPLNLTLTWVNSGDYDLTIDASDGYYFYKNRDITSAPGGETIQITQLGSDANMVIFANFYSGLPMAENAPSLTLSYGEDSATVTYAADQESTYQRYWIAGCFNGLEFTEINTVTDSRPYYSICADYEYVQEDDYEEYTEEV